MLKEILLELESLSLEDLQKLRDHLDDLIQSQFESDSDRRNRQRVHIRIPATIEIEREQEFFSQSHKATIRDMSVNGISFTTGASLIKGDILQIAFRLPSNGDLKQVDCKVVHVKEIQKGSNFQFEVGAVAVDKKDVISYRDMLKRRGR
jgi:hypothetical protein